MKADAQSQAEKEALDWAVDHFSRHRDDMNRPQPAGLSPRSVEAFVVTYIAALHDDPEWCDMADLVASAREDEASFDILVELTARLIERGAPLSGPLRDFVAGFLRNPMKVKRRPGPSRLDFHYRNIVIEGAVWQISDTWKFPATRHPDEAKTTAASIVSKALAKGANIKIGEAAVNKIWNAGAARRKRCGSALSTLPEAFVGLNITKP